jgi:hypothetical protein
MELRKIMLLAAVMAMVLAAAAPAFAQANAVGGSVQYVDCDQIQAAATGQYNTDNQQDLAGVAQELGVSQNQVLACLGSIAAGRDVNINASASASAATSTATAKMKAAKATATATAGGGGGSASAGGGGGGGGGSAAAASAAAGGALPSTGGASLLALGAGALLVAGGLLARRIVR